MSEHDEAPRLPTLLPAPVPADVAAAPAPAAGEDPGARGQPPAAAAERPAGAAEPSPDESTAAGPPVPFARVRSTPTPPRQ